MVSPEISRDTDIMLKSKQSPIIISNVLDTKNRAVSEKPVRLTKKNSTAIPSYKLSENIDQKCVISNNNILLISRSDLNPGHKTVDKVSVMNTVSKSVILPKNNKVGWHRTQRQESLPPLRSPRKRLSGVTNTAFRKLSVRPVKLESKELEPSTPLHINRIQTSSVKLGKKTEPPQEPINLSLKPQDKEKKIFLKVVDEKKLKYNPEESSEANAPSTFLSAKHKQFSIIPVVKLTDNSNPEVTEALAEKDPLAIEQDDETNESRDDIDDDEDSFLQKMGEEIGDLVQVKLECEPDQVDRQKTSKKLSYSCPKCSRSYSKKSLCEIHMKKVHFGLRSKEKCNICGVRFINLQAHKEKYHYFVDVDKCHLCGKVVKYLSSHHCPLQQDLRLKEIKLECPKCGNLVKQKYLKIHQKNHCVGISSTFSNFRTVNQELTDSPRIPLHLVSKKGPITASIATMENKERSQAIKQRTEIQLTPR